MIDDSEILALIEEYEKNSYGQNDQELSDDRAEALDRFYGRPYGDEIDGRSQVISQDTKDTILWVMPQLMKIFAAGNTVCKFNPRGPDDIEKAEQETEYVNYLVMEKNRGFEIIYNWFFDALLSKVGYVKIYWEDYEEVERETYKNLSLEEIAFILQNNEVEVIAHETTSDGINEYHSVQLEVKNQQGKLCIESVPPENMMVDYGVSGTCLQDADFVEELSLVSIGDLQAQGYDVSEMDAGEYDFNNESDSRDNYEEFSSGDFQPGKLRKATLRNVYIKLEDGGKLTRYHVRVVGKKVIEKEESEYVPYASLCPIPMPHRHVGLSYADIVMDLEKIKTRLLRNALDAQYLSIHGRHAINQNVVNIDDMLISRPGGVVRVDGPPTGEIAPLFNAVDGSTALNAMQYIDTILQSRTGVSDKTQGIAEDAIQETATATAKLMTAAQERIYMIARIFAETGVKDLFMLAHQLVRKHANKQDIFQLRDKWIPIDPREWKTRKDLSVTVGLGTGDKEEMRVNIMTILQAQMQAIPLGIASPKNIYNAMAKLTQNAGFKDVESYWTDPDTVPPQPPQPPPEVIKAQAQMQVEEFKAGQENQRHSAELEMEQRARQEEIMMESEKQAQQARNDMIEREHQLRLDAMNREMDRQYNEWKAQLDAATKVIVAQISAASKPQPAAAEAEAQKDYTANP